MTEMKKYHSIERMGKRGTGDAIKVGDTIVIQEKIDGSSASFMYSEDGIRSFSRNTELSPDNNLRGFYELSQTFEDYNLNKNYIYYGEYSCKHKVDYGNNVNKFYLFDIWDNNTQQYVDFNIVNLEAVRLNLSLVPTFYHGEYISYEHLESFVGKTELAINEGEGIVVKNVSYFDKYGRQLFVKLVTDNFREIQHQKAPKDPNYMSEEDLVVNKVLTEARVEKLLFKLVDEAILHEEFGIEDMGIILKNMSNRLYEDIVKEENELIKDFDQKKIRNVIGRTTPSIVKEIINKK